MFPRILIGSFGLSTWRLIVAAGVVLCWPLVLKRLKRLGHPPASALLLLVLALPVGTMGGRLFQRLIPVAFQMPHRIESGLTVIGSMVAVLAFAAFWLKRVLKTDLGPFLDATAFTLPLSFLIGRIGCLLNGCCFGTVAPEWAGNWPYRLFTLRAGLYEPLTYAGQRLKGTPAGQLVWNLPLALIAHELFLLVIVEALYRNRERWRLAPGTVLAAAIAQETAGRFLIEFLRWEDVVSGTPFNPWQASLAFLFVPSIAWLYLAHRSQAGGLPAAAR